MLKLVGHSYFERCFFSRYVTNLKNMALTEYPIRGEQFRKTKINSVGLSWKYKTLIGVLEIFQWEVRL